VTRDRVVVDANVLFSRFVHELIGRCGVFGIYEVCSGVTTFSPRPSA